ncbi:MAG: aspartate aminotransferase family protein [Alphaproteobacteria bacterium]|nr:MAG: aspartate aminotransferase family protein [Alphaproteobacteria bacterium]
MVSNSRNDDPKEANISPILPTYTRADLAVERGEGVYLYDTTGKQYLDFATGVAVNCLGHCHPHLVEALEQQARRIWHCSNNYRIPGQERLAERLTEATFADTVFFTNSGAEAIECALKIARRFHWATGAPERFRVITFEGAFHGRTLAAIAATGQEKVLKGFGPPVEGFDQVPFGDIEATRAAITRETAAILVEPIQGEGGIRPAPPGFLADLRALADEHGLLLILDEIQTGMGRTGRLFAHELSGIEPDVMASAKGIGGGFPLGACLATERVGRTMTAGSHGSTYGGNPLAMAVGNAVLDIILTPGFLDQVCSVADRLRTGLLTLSKKHDAVIDCVRGVGLMLGVRIKGDLGGFVARARDNGLLLVPAGDNVARLLPPLIVTQEHVEEALSKLEATCHNVAVAAQ